MFNEAQLTKTFQLKLPIKDGEFWDGRPVGYSNLKQWRLDFTQRFGMNLLDYSKFGLKGHNGIDIAGYQDTPIVAPCRLWITYTNDSTTGYGRYVFGETESIKANGDYYKLEMVFGHFNSIAVKPNRWVNQGDIIGYMGTTGYSTGNHLHFGIRPWWSENGNTWNQMFPTNGYAGYINPEPFMPHIVWDINEILHPVITKIINIGQGFFKPKDYKSVYSKEKGWHWEKIIK